MGHGLVITASCDADAQLATDDRHVAVEALHDRSGKGRVKFILVSVFSALALLLDVITLLIK